MFRDQAAKALSVLLVAACAGAPPAPVAGPPPSVSAAPAEISTIVVPIRTSLASMSPMLEAQVPKTFRKVDGYELDPQQRFGLKYDVERDPIALSMSGADLHASTTVRYAFEGCVRAKNPIGDGVAMWPCISCGFKEGKRQALIALQSRLEWGADWTLRSTTTAQPVQFPSRCAVTLLNIDITDRKLAPLVNEQLQALAKSIDRNTPKMVAIRPSALQIWNSLQTPAEVAPRAWLVLEPLDASLAPIRGSGMQVTSALTVHARTRIVVGSKPAVALRPLPQLGSALPDGSGMRVPLELQIPYDEASRLLNEQFKGHQFSQGGNDVRVESLKLLPGQTDRVTVEAMIDFNGGAMKRYHGAIYLEGTPKFESGSSRITFPDLRYSLDPKRKNPFLRMFDRMAHQDVERAMRAASWSLEPQMKKIGDDVSRSLTRSLSKGVSLRGRVDDIRPVSIAPTAEGLSLRVVVTGSAEVEVTRWQ